MKVNAQIWIDRHIIKHLVWLLNGLVRVVGKILNLNHDLKRDFERVAVAKYKGMGSILQATPLLNSLRTKYPNAEITFISTNSNKAFLETLPMIDKYIFLDDGSFFKLLLGFPKLIFQLLRQRFQVFIDLEIYSHFSSLITTLSAAQNRFGYYMQSGKYRHGTYTHLIYFNPKASMSQVYLQMARLLHCENINPELYNYKNLSVNSEKIKLEKPYIVINPNASDLRLERRWPSNSFIELSNVLSQSHPDHALIFVGAPSEANYTTAICALSTNNKVENLAGKTSLDELIAIIKDADFMISNDTGPLHIAFACRTPAIGLFGPISPRQFDIPKESIALYKNVYCSPCVHEFDVPPCNGNNVCMQNISVEDVLNNVEKLTDSSRNEESERRVIYQYNDEVLGVIKRTAP